MIHNMFSPGDLNFSTFFYEMTDTCIKINYFIGFKKLYELAVRLHNFEFFSSDLYRTTFSFYNIN